MQLLLGSGNEGKIIEITNALTGVNVDIVTPGTVGIDALPTETADTFAGNATEKAHFYHEHSGLPTLADDSGIIVESLASELGIHTRRWGAGKDATDEEWISYFLLRMEREKNRRAFFVCVLAYVDVEGILRMFEGRCEGSITKRLEAPYLPGLPLSACFKPDGYDRVFSALTTEEKNIVSHRGRALTAFREFLSKEAASRHPES